MDELNLYANNDGNLQDVPSTIKRFTDNNGM